MSGSIKDEVLRYDQRVVAARKIEAVLAGHHAAADEITRRIRHLAKDPLTLVVLGEFSAGKSSFLNRLFHTDALPVAILPKTATLTRLVHGDQTQEERVEIDRQTDTGTETEVVSRQTFADLQLAAKVHDITVAQELARIQEVRVFINEPLLTRLQLVDTPGFNHDQAMDERTLGVLERTDIVLWITDAIQPAKQTEFEKLRLLKQLGKHIWLIVNKADVNVADNAAWQESRQSLEQYFREIGFLDFFESQRVELISCRETDDFWSGKFEQTKARLGSEIFNLDVLWSNRLVADEWTRLREILEDEDRRYRELGCACKGLQALTRAKSLADQCLPDLDAEVGDGIRELQRAILKHGQTGRSAAGMGIASVTTFVLDCAREPLVQAYRALARDYDELLADWQIQHLTESIRLLDVVAGTLPAAYPTLRADVLALRTYYALLRERRFQPVGRVYGYRLPALERTTEMLGHLGVQAEELDWRFSLHVEQDGVLPMGISGTKPTLAKYRNEQLQLALERDFRSDLERSVRDPVFIDLLRQLDSLCHGAGKRLAAALKISYDHATSTDTD